jgi:hypothetical protein
MEGNMPDVNEEMKALAEFAIKSARDRYGLELDYSEQSIMILDGILEKVYWGFSSRSEDNGNNGLIYNTATIWGSYVGEYMRQKWGGTWIQKGLDQVVSIKNVEFSPISLVYQKITSRPDSTVEGYLLEMKRIMYRLTVDPQQAQYLSKKLGQFKEQINITPIKKPANSNKPMLLTIAGVGGILLIIAGWIIVLILFKTNGIPASGLFASASSTNTVTPTETTSKSSTPSSTNTQSQTITTLPTYTPKPSFTLTPSRTPSPTFTPTTRVTSTGTNTPLVPTRTLIPSRTPSSTPIRPTNPPLQPTTTPSPTASEIPSTPTAIPPTATELPPPTATEPPPVVIESCEIDPSTILAGQNETITLIVHFSAPGYGFTGLTNLEYPGQAVCSANDDNGDGVASCDGSSGLLPDSTTVVVTFKSSVGDCSASYRSR